jgi:predicted ATPase/transcriptional regulator with XRE-family HTH domain
MTVAEPFPSWLKRRRRALGLSRVALAQRAHCSASAIRRLEAGDLRPSPQLAGLLAEALGVPQAEWENFVRFARGVSQTPPAPDAYSPTFQPAPAAAPPDANPTEMALGSNLPAPLTSFVGRKQEVTAVCDLLQEPGVRLLTLTGPPGTGKTRLSLAAAAQLAGSATFPQGACFVSLAPISDPDQVLTAVAHALGVAEPPQAGDGPQALRQTAQEFLRSRRLLLVLDNFEQVLAAAPLVTDLLAAAPGVKALVTSRAVLHLYGEHEFPVPPLPLPDVHNLPTTTAVSYLSRYPALRLFQARARAVRPDFRLNAENVTDVARICAWLDGLPLAIEMAAAQMKWLTPAQALIQLKSRLAALTGGPRDLTPRQQSLSGAIDWSYYLLRPPERALFDLLGVFVGDFAATAVPGVIERLAMGDWNLDIGHTPVATLQSLVEKSLLTYLPRPEGEPRYAMLETLREYAQARLQEQGRVAAAQQAHALYYAALARAAQPFLSQGEAQVAWLDRLEREYLQLRAALAWGVETAVDASFVLELVENLHHFWYVRGHLSEGRHWLETAISLADAPNPLVALALNRAGQFARLQGDLSATEGFHEKALAMQQAMNDEAGTCRSLENLAILAGSQGDYGRSRELLEQTLTLRRKLAQRDEVISTLNNLAIVQRRLGNLDAAKALYQECAQVCRANGNLRHLSFALHGLGEVAVEQDEAAAGLNFFGESIRLRQQLGDRPELALSLRALGMARLALGEEESAVRLFAAGHCLQQTLGISLPPRYRAETEEMLARLKVQVGGVVFDRAWSEGLALSLDEAISLAVVSNLRK